MEIKGIVAVSRVDRSSWTDKEIQPNVAAYPWKYARSKSREAMFVHGLAHRRPSPEASSCLQHASSCQQSALVPAVIVVRCITASPSRRTELLEANNIPD
jgi:hypothetical protein